MTDIDSPYGVVAFIPSPGRFDAMKDANIAWGRYDFSWRSVESAGKGQFNWAVQDYAVAEANARGLHIYAGLGYTPAWASVAGNANSRPINLQDWYDYVYAAVSRYKGSIKYWEMWNEPNLSQFWNGTRQQYIDLLKVGADAAHAADPDCFVLGPDISSAGSPGTWMTDVLNQAGNKVDIIAFHQYDGNDTPAGRLALMDSMRNTINNAGYANKPIWITESGFRSDATGMTEQKQADYLTQTLAGITARPWIKKFFWYQIWEANPGEKWGLLRQDESRKPAWQAYQNYTLANPAMETVSVNPSDTDIVDGVNLVTVADGHTTPDTKASRRSRRNTDAAGGDVYMYFNVSDSFMFQANRSSVSIDVDYYDLGTGTLTLEYDSRGDGAYKSAGSVALGNKDTWKQFTFTLNDAYFGNRQDGGADFRITGGVGKTFYIDLVQVNGSPVVVEPGIAWARNATGGWQDGPNWTGGNAPNGVGAVATMGRAVAASTLVYANAPLTLGTLNFNNPNAYALTGLGTLTMQVAGGGSAQINVTQGTHQINLPLIIASDTVMNVSGGGGLVISDPVTIGAGRTLSKTGAGAVTYQSTVTVLGGGSLEIAGIAEMADLALAADARADVNGSLVVQGTNYDAITARVRQGYNGGDWLGNGITSSAAASDVDRATTLGLIDSGQEVLVSLTYYGDADLSGGVDLRDFHRFVDGFGAKHGRWLDGDFDLNGSIDLQDFALYLQGFKHQPSPVVTPALLSAVGDFAAAQGLDVDLTALPEPSALAALTLASGALLRRNSRRRRVRAAPHAQAVT